MISTLDHGVVHRTISQIFHQFGFKVHFSIGIQGVVTIGCQGHPRNSGNLKSLKAPGQCDQKSGQHGTTQPHFIFIQMHGAVICGFLFFLKHNRIGPEVWDFGTVEIGCAARTHTPAVTRPFHPDL